MIKVRGRISRGIFQVTILSWYEYLIIYIVVQTNESGTGILERMSREQVYCKRQKWEIIREHDLKW